MGKSIKGGREMRLIFEMDENNEIDVMKLLSIDETKQIIAIIERAYKRQYGVEP